MRPGSGLALRVMHLAVGRRWLPAATAAILAWGTVLRCIALSYGPLHPDECLYATWALAIGKHRDLWLRSVALDKPPLYPYLLAIWAQVGGYGPTSLRLLGLAFSLLGLALLAKLAVKRFGPAASVLCLTLAALSPVAVALDGSALTDPAAVSMSVAASAAAGSGLPLAAGLLLGLSVATKPQLLAYLPLVALAGGRPNRERTVRVLLGFAAVMLSLVAWEAIRRPEQSFLALAFAHYGGLHPASWQLAGQWAGLLSWVWGRASMGLALAAVCLFAAVLAWRRGSPIADGDWLAVGAGLSLLLYIGVSMGLGMPAWDRYALPAVPLCALLATWALSRLSSLLPWARFRQAFVAMVALGLAAAMAGPAQEAAQHRLPLADTSRWQGIETIAAYVRGQVPGRATLLYQDFGWEIHYYLEDFPQDMRWFEDDAALLREVGRGSPCYLLLPADDTGRAQVAMVRGAGYDLHPCVVGYGHNGQPTMALWLVERASG